MVSVRVILGRFCFYFSLLFYILGAILIKQLFYSRLLDMRWLQPTRRYAPRWLSIISYPTRARRIIVKYDMATRLSGQISMFGGAFCFQVSFANCENLRFWPESLGSMFDLWYIERAPSNATTPSAVFNINMKCLTERQDNGMRPNVKQKCKRIIER